jgi:hypothetical protein
MKNYTSTEILTAFKNLAYSRGYRTKIVGDYAYTSSYKQQNKTYIKFWGTKDAGSIMDIYDTKVGHREQVPTGLWL